jgi:DNA-binding FadR family transcriptional regulator
MDELIRLCAAAARIACLRMTPLYLKVLHDSVEQARRMPFRFAWDRKVAAHAGIFNLLADVAGDPVLAVPLRDARGHISDLMVTVGPAADGIILSSRRRLLALIRVGEADDVAREMEQHLGGPVLDAAPVPQLSTDRHRCLTRLILRTWKLLNSRQGHSAAVLT